MNEVIETIIVILFSFAIAVAIIAIVNIEKHIKKVKQDHFKESDHE